MDIQKTTQQKILRQAKRRKTWQEMINDRQLYYMLVPVVIYYILFMYLPYYGLQMAFKDYRPFLGIIESPWIGWDHFVNFFTGPYAWRLIRNTFLISFYSLMISTPLTIILALLLNEIVNGKAKSTIQTVLYMPHFISTVVVAGLFISMLSPSSGVINIIIEKLGGEKIAFLYEPKYFRTIYITMTQWQGLGYGTIIYTSAMCAIDESLYEAAEIDGAGRFRKMWHITLPGILPTTVTLFIMNIGKLLTVGSEAILLLYQPITYETADVISTFVYRYGLEQSNYSYSTAVGLFNGIVSLVLVVGANIVSRKVSEVSLW